LLRGPGAADARPRANPPKDVPRAKGTTLAEHGGVKARRRVRQRGFSLIELFIVVMIIGVIAALAIPTMSVTHFDRRAYDDAGSVTQLLRSARTRAIARGGAVLVAMTSNGTTDRGTFLTFEAVSTNVTDAFGNTGLNRTPVSSCKSPTNWTPLPVGGTTNTSVLLVDGVNLNAPLDGTANIQTQFFIYPNPTTNAQTAVPSAANICYSPLGRSYVATGAAAQGMFDGQLPTVSPFEIMVTFANGGTKRSVLLPPNGMARLFSHV
jgi:prepilin-type N-terminal cleavage/methylation domain-containing protein